MKGVQYRTVDTSTLAGLRLAERMKEAGELATFRGDNSGWRIVAGFAGLDRVRFRREPDVSERPS